MYKKIEAKPENFVPSTERGLEKVRTEKYAYISETQITQKVAAEDPSLFTIKEKFFVSKLAFVVANGWPYKKYFDVGYVVHLYRSTIICY